MVNLDLEEVLWDVILYHPDISVRLLGDSHLWIISEYLPQNVFGRGFGACSGSRPDELRSWPRKITATPELKRSRKLRAA